MRDLTPEWIDRIRPYVPGKPIEEVQRELGIQDVAKLASNENCLGPSPKGVEAAQKALSEAHLYPDATCFYLRGALAERLGVPPARLVFGNGSHELIDLAVRTFVFPDESVLTADVTFVAYQLAAKTAGREIVRIPVKDMAYDLPAMADAINEKTKLILLANPNNPTGTIFRAAELEKFMERVPPDVVTVVDEAYFEFVDDPEYPDSLRYNDGQRRMMTLRTFSKAYGLAGFRVGYGICTEAMATALNKVRLVFNVGRVAQAAALGALNDREHVERSAQVVRAGLEYLYAELEKRSVRFWRSHTNFVFIDFERDSDGVYEALLKEGVIIRPMPGPYARVTVGRPEENRRFIEALDRVREGWS